MKNIWIIFQREYLIHVKKSSFFIITLIAPILILFSIYIINYISHNIHSNYKIAVVNDSSTTFDKLDLSKKFTTTYFNIKSLDSLKGELNNNSIKGILYINNKGNDIKLIQNENISSSVKDEISDIINEQILLEKSTKIGLSSNQIDSLNKTIIIKTVDLKTGLEDNSGYIKVLFALFLMYTSFMFILIYGTRIMRSITEEKSNRVVEIIISSVKPYQLMIGKILGTTAVAITQFGIWIFLSLALLFFLHKGLTNSPMGTIIGYKSQDINTLINILFSTNYLEIIFIFLFYFIAGYLFYSSFFCAIGSAVEGDTETQQFMPLIITPLMIGLISSFLIANSPHGTIAKVLSYIPFTAPMVMTTRSPFDIPMHQIIISMLIMILSTSFMIFVASKIYKIGILTYGEKINLKLLTKWLKQS